MDRVEALKEAIKQKQFNEEPLACAILLYLNKSNPQAHKEIMDIFDAFVDNHLETLIKETLDNELSAKVDAILF